MIIQSLLDTDLYKFTMQQLVWKWFPRVRVRYQFYCRSSGVDFSGIEQGFTRELRALQGLFLLSEECAYLRSLGFFSKEFLSWLQGFRFQSDLIRFRFIGRSLVLEIEGPWVETILFEVPLLAILSELLSEADAKVVHPALEKRLAQKSVDFAGLRHQFLFSDFGTRRRASYCWQKNVLTHLLHEFPARFYGTSNVCFAKKFGITPVGTMAHEYLQACQALSGSLSQSQNYGLSLWAREYGPGLRIALSDVLGLRSFLSEFSEDLARAYSGVRHDSGDPFEFGNAMLRFYQKLGIDPAKKVLVFSDRLDFATAEKIQAAFCDRIPVRFGIGTFLTHDPTLSPPNMVIKMTHCNGKPVAKISDSPGKAICEDPDYYREALEFRNRF